MIMARVYASSPDEQPADRTWSRRSSRAAFALLDALEDGVGEDLELGHLPVEVGLVVREVGDHPLALLGALGAEAQVVVVVLEGREAEGGQAAGQPRAQRAALVVVEEEPELLVDEVPQEAELLLRQFDVVVRRMEHYAYGA